MTEIEAPVFESRAFLMTAGRALSRWWNENGGPNLPIEGLTYQSYWKETYRGLQDGLFAPRDVFDQLQIYAQEARQWWDRQPSPKGPPPPMYAQQEVLSETKLKWGTVLVGGLVVLALLWRSR